MKAIALRVSLAMMTLGVVVGAAGRAEADLIVSRPIHMTWDSGLGPDPFTGVDFSFGVNSAGSKPHTILNLSLTTDDVGKTFEETSAKQTKQFAALVGLLTNGEDDLVKLSVDPVGGGFNVPSQGDATEQSFFKFKVKKGDPNPRVDLAGYEITRIALRVHELATFEVTGADGFTWQVANFAGSLDFEGVEVAAVPEPSTLAVGLAATLAGIGAWLKRRRKLVALA